VEVLKDGMTEVNETKSWMRYKKNSSTKRKSCATHNMMESTGWTSCLWSYSTSAADNLIGK
jgi:hypothetical protein